jgi:polyketide biosynthesis 3-hydroxy-3-methylglutaryl-CoA synthase-like enzyme PksG
MDRVGIEAINIFGGTAALDVRQLAVHRGLDMRRFDNLMMYEKSVALPFEDPVTFGVNAARPIIDHMSLPERSTIELLITCTESGLDFGKSLSTYIHDYLQLSRHCRLFEIKQACYAGTAGLHCAINHVLAQQTLDARALVVASDITRPTSFKDLMDNNMSVAYAEPSSGAGAVAFLVSREPRVFEIDRGAHGIYAYEVMDTCRPVVDGELGDSDLSLLSYLDCLEHSFSNYRTKVNGAHILDHYFESLVFHAPFAGLVKGAHRSMLRKLTKLSASDIERDFCARLLPSLKYCQRVGNVMAGTMYLALASMIYHNPSATSRRVGCFSYGSGCCSEFFSGCTSTESFQAVANFDIEGALNRRIPLSVTQYEKIGSCSDTPRFGVRDLDVDNSQWDSWSSGRPYLALKRIRNYHREYSWR